MLLQPGGDDIGAVAEQRSTDSQIRARDHGAQSSGCDDTGAGKENVAEERFVNSPAGNVNLSREHTNASLKSLGQKVPPSLMFLENPECNPDFSDPRMCEVGYVHDRALQSMQSRISGFKEVMKSQGAHEAKPKKIKEGMPCWRSRNCVGKIVQSAHVQAVVICVIALDLITTIIELSGNSSEGMAEARNVCDGLVIVILGSDVLGRMFFQGLRFWTSAMNVFEFLLVPLAILEVFVLQHADVPLPILRALRPIFRAGRVVRILFRAATRGSHLQHLVKSRMAGMRRRFVEDGFDLDLVYINTQLIVTSVPAVGVDAFWRNPLREMARFLNERHTNKYVLVNLAEANYPPEPFFERILNHHIDYLSVPTLLELKEELCAPLTQYMQADPSNVVCIHSKNGRGRVALVTAALLLYSGDFVHAKEALDLFERCRTDEESGMKTPPMSVDTASQARFIEYFAQHCRGIQITPPKKAKLHRIRVIGLPDSLIQTVHFRGFQHPASSSHGKLEDGDSQPDDDDDDEFVGEVMDMTLNAAVEFPEHELAGGLPQDGPPLFNTKEDSNCTSLRADATSERYAAGNAPPNGLPSGISRPVIWEFTALELSAEIKFEMHCDNLHSAKRLLSGSQDIKLKGSVSNKDGKKREKRNKAGMMFSFWLHTNFLESYQVVTDWERLEGKPSKLGSKLVCISLRRGDVDKAAESLPLSAYSTSFEIRVEWEIESDDQPLLDSIYQKPSIFNFHTGSYSLLRAPTASKVEDTGGLNSAKLESSNVEVCEAETLDWLNWCVERLWPYAEAAVEKLLREMVEPMLADALPGPLKNSVWFADFSLGKVLPKLGSVTAMAQNHEGFGLQLDIPVTYRGDAKILVEAGMAVIGISHIEICGVLAVCLKPILHELPIVAGVQLFFMNAPTVDIRFTGHLDFANVRQVRSAILEAINNGVASLFVLPNLLVIEYSFQTLEAEDNIVRLENVLPQAVLRLTVHEARGLPIGDSSLLSWGPGSGEPYVVVQLGAERLKSRTVFRTAQPRWEQEFDLVLHSVRQEVSITVYDQHFAVKGDDTLGKIRSVSVLELLELAQSDRRCSHFWLPLQENPKLSTTPRVASENATSRPEICLSATLYELHADRSQIPAKGEEIKVVVSKKMPDQKESNVVCDGGLSPWATWAEGCTSRCTPTKQQENFPAAPSPATQSISCGCRPVGGGCFVPPIDTIQSSSDGVLICRLAAGRVPAEIALPENVELEVSVGSVKVTRSCCTKWYGAWGHVAEDVQDIVEEFAKQGKPSCEIADLIGKEPHIVQRIMDKRLGKNLEILKRFTLLVPADMLAPMERIVVSVIANGRLEGKANIYMGQVLDQKDLKLRELLHIPWRDRDDVSIELDMEVALFALVEADTAQLILRMGRAPSEEAAQEPSQDQPSEKGQPPEKTVKASSGHTGMDSL